MVQIVLNDEQLEIVRRSGEPGELVDRTGQRVGQFTPASLDTTDPDVAIALERMTKAGQPGNSAEDRAEIKRRMANDDGTRYTLAEIMERVRALAPE